MAVNINTSQPATSSNSPTLTAIQEKLEEIERKFEAQKQKMDEFDKKISLAESHIEESKSKTIETIGIFVALFTFVSIEFNILRNSQSFTQLLSLTFILGGILILFILVLDLIIKDSWRRLKDNDLQKNLLLGSSLLIAVGLVVALIGAVFHLFITNFSLLFALFPRLVK